MTPEEENAEIMAQAASIEEAAKRCCEPLFRSKLALAYPDAVESLVIVAFTFGASWASEREDLVALGQAQFEAAHVKDKDKQ